MSEWPATFAGLTPQEARRLDALCERFVIDEPDLNEAVQHYAGRLVGDAPPAQRLGQFGAGACPLREQAQADRPGDRLRVARCVLLVARHTDLEIHRGR